jgi:osmotically-inducible protein OsmY
MASQKNYIYKLVTSFSDQKILKKRIGAMLFMLMLMVFSGCSQQNQDKHIKADLAAKTKSELNFAGVNYTVDGGVVTLTGKCASEKSKSEAEQLVKSINIVKGIINQIEVAPVVLNADLPLKQAVDSVLKSYPAVQANVSGNIILLQGKTGKKDVSKLLSGLNELHAAKIDNQLKVE